MKINSESELNKATEVVEALINVEDLSQVLPENDFGDIQLNKAYKTIKHLREMYPLLVDSDRGPYQLWIALLRYAVHTLSFEECNDYQKKLALYSSGLLAQKVLQHAKISANLRVDYTHSFGNQLGMTILPGRKDRNRNLEDDIQCLIDEGIDIVIPLIMDHELVSYGVPNLLKTYKDKGLQVRQVEIVDQGIPSKVEMQGLVTFVKEQLAQNKKILIHCVGGVGRTGTLVSCCLKELKGFSTEEAIAEVRKSRSPRAVENKVQEEFVRLW
jgi:protein-tyrosine phosphatase